MSRCPGMPAGSKQRPRSIVIRRCRPGDARAICGLISRTYARFCSREGTRAAVRRYVEGYRPQGKRLQDLQERLVRTPFCLVALSGSRVVGVLRARENRLVNLFVDGAHHRQRVATRLFRRFERACQEAGHKEVTVRSSLYAVLFYEAVGYRKTTGVRNHHGLGIQPMRKRLG